MQKTKQHLPKNLLTEHGFDLSSSYAYGNHHSDVYKLELFGYPVAVNPDRELRRIAAEEKLANRNVSHGRGQ